LLKIALIADGSSLIYTTPFQANSLQSLIHSSLGIHSLLKRQSLKHNVIDRDKILVPANWDSWGKIRIIREGFDIEGVGTSWSIEIQEAPEPFPATRSKDSDDGAMEGGLGEDSTRALIIYEHTIRDPKRGTAIARNNQSSGHKIEVETRDAQVFLAEQLEVLEKLKAEDGKQGHQTQKGGSTKELENPISMNETARVHEHIGPVQFNMGGIQVDADDMLRKLKVGTTS
jgi:dynein light intermediate chain 1